MDKLCSIVIPTYNEEKNIKPLIRRLLEQKRIEISYIIFVDNWSEDDTKWKIDYYAKKFKNLSIFIIDESRQWVKFARYKWIEYSNYLNNKNHVILQLDADSLPNSNKWLETHLKQYNNNNIWLVWWSLRWTNRSIWNKISLFIYELLKWRIIKFDKKTLIWLKNYFEKRNFHIKNWIIPAPGSNMSYLSDIWIRVKPHKWDSNLWEDYYRATKTVELLKKEWKDYVLIDNPNILVNTLFKDNEKNMAWLINYLNKYKPLDMKYLLNNEKL